MLVRTISEIKKHLRVNFINDKTSIPNMDRPIRKFIIPLLGKELYDELLSRYTANETEENHLQLLYRVQAVLIPLAYWLELPLINTQISDNGLQKGFTSDKPVFKYDFNKVMSTLLDQGMDESEVLLAFLEENKTNYPLWVGGQGYSNYRSLIIKSGKEFNDIYTLSHPRRCYLAMLPNIQLVQDMYIIDTIGKSFFLELKDKIAPSPIEQDAIILIKKAVAYLAIAHSVLTLSVRLTETGFTIQIADPDLGDTNRQSASGNETAPIKQEAERAAHSYLVKLKLLLNKHASNAVFQAYFNSEYYKDPSLSATDLNSQLKSTFTF